MNAKRRHRRRRRHQRQLEKLRWVWDIDHPVLNRPPSYFIPFYDSLIRKPTP